MVFQRGKPPGSQVVVDIALRSVERSVVSAWAHSRGKKWVSGTRTPGAGSRRAGMRGCADYSTRRSCVAAIRGGEGETTSPPRTVR